MKKIISLAIITAILNAGILDIFKELNSVENPNGKPFLLTFGYNQEKTNLLRESYSSGSGQYDKFYRNSYYIKLPLTNFITINYSEPLKTKWKYDDEWNSDREVIYVWENGKNIVYPEYNLNFEFHLPLYELWNN